MIMPFFRLVTIYAVVILAAVLFFNRDTVLPLLGFSGGDETASPSKPVAKTPSNTPPNTPKPVAAKPIVTPTATKTVPRNQPPKYPTADTAQITAPPKASDNFQARLTQARQAYWKRDYASAEAHYKGLAHDAPNNADIMGELGNLYYGQRRMDEAAQMFHRAGIQLIKDGKSNQARILVNVLQSISPSKAKDLQNRLSQ